MLSSTEIREIKKYALQKYIPYNFINNQEKLIRLIDLIPTGKKIRLSIILLDSNIETLTRILKELQYSFTIKKGDDRSWLTIKRKIGEKKLKEFIPISFNINLLDLPTKELVK